MEWKTKKEDKKNLYVTKVLKKSQAADGNVTVGSKLLAINGEKIEDLGAKKIYGTLAVAEFPITITFLKPHQPETAMKEISVLFEDDTSVTISVDKDMTSVDMISKAMIKRGWSETMTHLFNLCIKDDDADEDQNYIVPLEDNATPIASLQQYCHTLNIPNPVFFIQYKQQ